MNSTRTTKSQPAFSTRLLAQFFLISFLASRLLLAADSPASKPSSPQSEKLLLRDHWTLQSSAKFESKGETISTPAFVPKGWHDVAVPTTVVAALVKDKTLPDPFFAMNLRQFPGVTYPIGGNFSDIAMQTDSPYAVSWWYRKAFTVPASYTGKTVWLNFKGINYRANVWLNGKQIANSNDVAGAWRTYEFNVTDAVKPGAENVLAVQVFAPTENDLAITFVDWNPAPPDKNMGLWREVYLTTSGPVALRYPTVVSKLNLPSNDQAKLTVTVQLKNGLGLLAVLGQLKGQIGDVAFEQNVVLQPNESKDITFTPDKYPQLVFTNPRLWWPRQMGKPNLYALTMEFVQGGSFVSDRTHTEFGIREVTSEVNSSGGRAFHINGKNILIRGGGWTPDMMLRENSQRLHDEFRYVRDMGLNTIRLEGKLETQEFFDLADHEGILVMAGWCCCDFWERWTRWKPQDFEIAQQSLRDQIYRLRSHPSLLLWANGSDNPPPPDVEQMYLDIEKQLLWPNPVISSATGRKTSVSGDSGVKMTGPYEYIAPSYWELDTPAGQPNRKACNPGGCGGAYGFNTETSMGPAVPPIESIRAMVGKDHLWPIDDVWNYHAGGGEFKTIQVFSTALANRYGKSGNAEDFAAKSQMQTYEGVRAMYEAYSRNKYQATGVIQWMLNNAWPSMIWHLYDYYLRPGGGYFGAKRAMEALHPLYGYDDHSIWLVSSQYEDVKGLKLTTKIYNLDMTEKFSHEDALNADADSTAKIFTLPAVDGLSPVYFVALRLTDSTGKLVGSNFYWLSTKPETLDWAKTNWWMTPTDSFADFTALAQLPKLKLKVIDRTDRKGEDSVTHVTIENPNKSLAFFVRLKVNKGVKGEEILPVVWEDNYISLLPGEKREITATYRTSELGTAKPAVEVTGWNVE
jgi:exo-1,4-beta-D-glucosaminidase